MPQKLPLDPQDLDFLHRHGAEHYPDAIRLRLVTLTDVGSNGPPRSAQNAHIGSNLQVHGFGQGAAIAWRPPQDLPTGHPTYRAAWAAVQGAVIHASKSAEIYADPRLTTAAKIEDRKPLDRSHLIEAATRYGAAADTLLKAEKVLGEYVNAPALSASDTMDAIIDGEVREYARRLQGEELRAFAMQLQAGQNPRAAAAILRSPYPIGPVLHSAAEAAWRNERMATNAGLIDASNRGVEVATWIRDVAAGAGMAIVHGLSIPHVEAARILDSEVSAAYEVIRAFGLSHAAPDGRQRGPAPHIALEVAEAAAA